MTEDIDYQHRCLLCLQSVYKGWVKQRGVRSQSGLAYVDLAVIRVETAESGDNPIIDLPAQLMTSDTAPPYLVLFI